MSWTSWTHMRHAMALAIQAGAVKEVDDKWQCTRRSSTPAQMSRACNWLWDGGAIQTDESGRAFLTDDGARLLAGWNQRHPEVSS